MPSAHGEAPRRPGGSYAPLSSVCLVRCDDAGKPAREAVGPSSGARGAWTRAEVGRHRGNAAPAAGGRPGASPAQALVVRFCDLSPQGLTGRSSQAQQARRNEGGRVTAGRRGRSQGPRAGLQTRPTGVVLPASTWETPVPVGLCSVARSPSLRPRRVPGVLLRVRKAWKGRARRSRSRGTRCEGRQPSGPADPAEVPRGGLAGPRVPRAVPPAWSLRGGRAVGAQAPESLPAAPHACSPGSAVHSPSGSGPRNPYSQGLPP